MPKRNTSTKKLSSQIPPCDPDPVGYDDISKVHPALRPYLGYCLHKVTTIFRARVNAEFLQHEIQGQHFAVLSVISLSPEINQMKICEEMGIDKASMVKITDHLEKKKLIERIGSKEDRRVKNLVITPKGSKFLLMAQTKRVEIEKDFLSMLEDSEIKMLKELILKVLDQQKSSKIS